MMMDDEEEELIYCNVSGWFENFKTSNSTKTENKSRGLFFLSTLNITCSLAIDTRPFFKYIRS